MDYRNPKLNTTNWQILKLPPREEINLYTPQTVEEIKTELVALGAIVTKNNEGAQDPPLLRAAA